MPNLGPTELIIIGVVLVLLFGATRLPQTAKGLGQALKIFKKEVRDDDKPAQPEVQAAPVQQAAAPAPAQAAPAQETAQTTSAGAASDNGTSSAPAQSVQDADSTRR